ncbi:nuclear transport factor 2 family protein [Actinomadura sp. ATCC 31491]|uniref:Nuclear transport factor 2 family protein n=1 Tax=Actinomadura luzonensis TaxID=2805427 RepID=A0ABT0FT34_9ACTN|nr:nuclear transport factor 2 family protein [Actinomadura luzonensis]MCK2215160.1 nuclear transport factor 2 family protein [Actinomadura luzonensis]
MSATPSAREVAERFLAAATGDGLADLYAEDSVIELPFSPEGRPLRFEGREGHRARFARAAGMLRHERTANVTIHETTDPEVVVLEFDLHSVVIPTGRPVVRTYAMVMRVRDGLITHSRDYADTLAAAELTRELRSLVP